MKKLIQYFLLLSLMLGCSSVKTPAAQVAFKFMDAYYVQVDPRAALPFTDRLAFEKVKQSVDLTQTISQEQPGMNQQAKAKISYKLLPNESNDQEGLFVFEVKIHPEKSSEMTRKTMVRVRLSENPQEKDMWKVTQFMDQDTTSSPKN
ncbi:MAG: hypothetical protein IPJ69_00520 [Deltaproteobacteria bacterium]|nr:MAG: hypothetical protein IPJ69_00520 [Deltaproteobacteria bacterium]